MGKTNLGAKIVKLLKESTNSSQTTRLTLLFKLVRTNMEIQTNGRPKFSITMQIIEIWCVNYLFKNFSKKLNLSNTLEYGEYIRCFSSDEK